MSLEPRCVTVEPLQGAATVAGFAASGHTNPCHHPGGAAPGDGGGALAAATRAAPATADGRARHARRWHDGLGPCVGGSAAGLPHMVAASNTSSCSLEHLGSEPPAHSHLDPALSGGVLRLQEAHQRNEQRELACAAARRQRHAAHEARQPGGGAVEIESKSNTAGSNRPATSEQMRQRRKELGLLSTKEARRAVLTRA